MNDLYTLEKSVTSRSTVWGSGFCMLLAVLMLLLPYPSMISAQEDAETTSSLGEVIQAVKSDSPKLVLKLSADSPGTKSFTFSRAGTVRCTALLSTWHPASLAVQVRTAKGRDIEWMTWNRQNDGDPSRLRVSGKEIAESIFHRGGGDYSPNSSSHDYAGEAGDVVTLSLSGNVTERALLTLEVLSGDGKISDSMAANAPTSASPGRKVAVHIPFDRDWELTYNGTVTGTKDFARLMQGNETVHNRRIDLWTMSGRGLSFRLANKAIYFTSARVGKVRNPGAKANHWLETTVSGVRVGQRFQVKIVYSATSNRVQIYFDGKLAADADFTVKHLPKPQTGLEFPNSTGEVEVTLK